MDPEIAQVLPFPQQRRPAPSFTWWAANRRMLAPKTIKDYSGWIRNAQRWLGYEGLSLESAGKEDLLRYFDSLRPTYSLRNNVRHALAAYYDYLAAVDVRCDNPATALPRSKPPRKLPKPIPRQLIPELIAEAQRYRRPVLGCLVILYLNTGLRLNELCTRRKTDLVDRHIYLEVKGGGQRCVYLNDAAAGALADWLAICPPESPWMFPSPLDPARHISTNWVYSKIKDFGEAVGIEGCRPHRLRHTFATTLYAQTRDLLVVKEALGHTDIKNTLVYTQAYLFGVQSALEQLTFD